MVTMQAIEATETGGPEILRNVEKPTPSPGPGEVLIKAEAIGVNFVDTYFRSGLYPREVPFVLGAEVGGTVAAVGDGVTALRVGDRVATADAIGATPNTALRQPMSLRLCRMESTQTSQRLRS
jgi:NADPH2:quinone reductase